MKKFFGSVLKAVGYFGIYLGTQLFVTYAYMFFVAILSLTEYTKGNYDMGNPVIFNRFMDEVMQKLLDATIPITILSGILMVVVVWLMCVTRKQKVTKALYLRKISGGTGIAVAMMGFGFNLLLGMVFNLLPEAWLSSYEEAANTVFTGELWVIAVMVGLAAPVVEEIVFRGLIYTRLKQGMPLVAAAVISAVWFGAMHGHPLWIAYASLLGLVMAWIFERTKSLFASMLFHFGYNLVAIIDMALPESTPDWLGIVMLGVGAVLSVIGVYWFLKFPKAEELPEIDAPVTIQTDVEAAKVTEENVVENTEESTESLK